MRPFYTDWTASAPGWASPADLNRRRRAMRWDSRTERWLPVSADAAATLAAELEDVAARVSASIEGRKGLEPSLLALRSYAGACNRVAAEIRRLLES